MTDLAARATVATRVAWATRAATGGRTRRPAGPARLFGATLAVAVLVAATASCGRTDTGPPGPATVLRLGVFANLTHATALVGLARGLFDHRLGTTRLRTQVFNAGPAAVEALFSGDLDAAYLGPSPAVNAWAQSHGEAIRIVAGATSGGASLVVRAGITRPSDLRGTHLATPQLGNTQDVALRAWLTDHDLRPSSAASSGDVQVAPTDNATTLALFSSGRLDGAWVPEPWASRLVVQGAGHVLVDERSLWPHGRFVTANLVVRTDFLHRHRETVRALLEGQVDANAWIAGHPSAVRHVVNTELVHLGGRPLPAPVVDRALRQLATTNDPLAATLRISAAHAVAAGLLDPVDLHGIYDLGPLRAVLADRHLPTVSDAGLGGDG